MKIPAAKAAVDKEWDKTCVGEKSNCVQFSCLENGNIIIATYKENVPFSSSSSSSRASSPFPGHCGLDRRLKIHPCHHNNHFIFNGSEVLVMGTRSRFSRCQCVCLLPFPRSQRVFELSTRLKPSLPLPFARLLTLTEVNTWMLDDKGFGQKHVRCQCG